MTGKAKTVAIKSTAIAPAPAKVRPADSWPFPTPGISKRKVKTKAAAKKSTSPKNVRISATDIRKHVVKASLNNVELAKAKSALSLDLYANGKKIGNLEVGQGSFFWTGARRKKSKPIGWSKFADMMNELAYK